MDEAALAHLGKQSSDPVDTLDRIPWSSGNVVVRLDCSEFTSHCPVTRQPDFASLRIEYIPGDFIAETKSVKLYLWRFRDRAQFNEKLTAEIAQDFHDQLQPRAVRVVGSFNTRGGIAVTAECTRGEPGLL